MIMEKKSIFYWIVFVLLTIWQLPQFIVSLVMMPFIGKLKIVRNGHYNICFIAKDMLGGISLGPFSFISPTMAQDLYIAHEFDGHSVDSKIWGPLYLLVVGIPSLMNAAFGFTKCYYDFYTERWANKHAGLEVHKYTGGYSVLRFKKDTDSDS